MSPAFCGTCAKQLSPSHFSPPPLPPESRTVGLLLRFRSGSSLGFFGKSDQDYWSGPAAFHTPRSVTLSEAAGGPAHHSSSSSGGIPMSIRKGSRMNIRQNQVTKESFVWGLIRKEEQIRGSEKIRYPVCLSECLCNILGIHQLGPQRA